MSRLLLCLNHLPVAAAPPPHMPRPPRRPCTAAPCAVGVYRMVFRHRTSPVMCATQFTPEGLLRHGSAIEIYPMFGASPVLHPFWAAGFSFARGHFAVRVPYDCCTPMLFQVT